MAAKSLLVSRGLAFVSRDVEDDPKWLDVMRESFPTAKTMPQIVHDKDGKVRKVGTYTDLVEFLK